MTKAQVTKIGILRAKIEAGATIKESEWLPWQKAPKALKYDDERNETTMRHLYLDAMGINDESDANPAAIYWSAYEALERGESCQVCGRGGEKTCRPCDEWTRTMMDRELVRSRVSVEAVA